MPTDCLITLTVKPAPATDGETFLYHVDVDGQPIINNQTLAVKDAKEMRDLAASYGELFEQRFRPQLTDETLNTLGARLFDLWLGHGWAQIEANLGPGCRRWLVIASEVSEVLNLPWELLRPASDDAIGSDAKWTVRRFPRVKRSIPQASGKLRPGPLRLLFMACQPKGSLELDFEKEERYLLAAMGGAGKDTVYDSCDLGTYDELEERIDSFQPHIVHLIGHGVVRDGQGWFAFEDEDGDEDLRPSSDIGQLFAGSGVQCAFVSGCQTGKAPERASLGGICQGLVRQGVPIAIGWAASIADSVAGRLAETFYNRVAGGQPVDRALSRGRGKARELCREGGDPSWTLPVLYAATQQTHLLDPRLPPELPSRQSLTLQPLSGMTDGYAPDFIGRRRELQRLLPPLRRGQVQGVVLTGLGGAGKSTLANRLARKLEADGFSPIAVSAPPRDPETLAAGRDPITAAKLLETCADAFLDAGLEKDEKIIRAADRYVSTRLRHVVTTLNKHPFLLVLDNLETNMDEETRRIRDTEISSFFQHLTSHLTRSSRVIVTSRFIPAEADPLPSLWREQTLGDFPEGSFVKYMMRDPAVEHRYYGGELPPKLLQRLHRLLGGTPRFMEQIRKVLQTVKQDELARELDAVEQGLPQDAGQSQLQAARDRYCEDIFTGRLYRTLSKDLQKWLSRAAVFAVPVPLEGLAAAAGAPIEAVRDAVQAWQRSGLVYPEVTRSDLWSIYGTLRGWLAAPDRLPADERRSAQEAAADFLVEMEKQNREGEIGLSWVDCLLEARSLYLAGDAVAKAREVTGRISDFLILRGLYRELEWINQEVLAQESHSRPMLDVGRSFSYRADYASARRWFERALEIAKEGTADRADVLHSLATIDLNQGNYLAARENFGKSLEIKQQIGNRAGEAATWHQLATIDLNQGNFLAARDKFGNSLEIKEEIGNRAGEAATWAQLGSIDAKEGKYPAARDKFGKALATFQQIGDPAGEATTWHLLASVDLDECNYPAAQGKIGKALAMQQQIGDRVGEAHSWQQLGLIAWKRGDRSQGIKLGALGFVVLQIVGHANVQAALRNLTYAAGELGYGQEQLQALLQEVMTSYQTDGGRALYREAFGEELSPA